MGKKGKNRGGMVVSSAAGDDQAAQALKAQQEAEFLAKAGYGPKVSSGVKGPELGFDVSGSEQKSKGGGDKNQVIGQNESEKMFQKICREIEAQKDAKYEHNHWEMTSYAVLDNNLIDSYFSNLHTFSDEWGYGEDMLAEKELIHHLRKITKILEFLDDFTFWRFWAYIIKFPLFLDFIDEFLQNIRKYNDIEKIQIDLNQSFNDSKLSSFSHPDLQTQLKYQLNKTLKIIFKIMYRLSQNMEGDNQYFSADFYRDLVYNDQIFDMAKLLDIAAVYGKSNQKMVQSLVENVFECAPKYQNDFKEAFDMMLNAIKRSFKDALKVDEMLRGDATWEKSRTEQDLTIIRLVQDIIEALTNFQLITAYFGEGVMEQVSTTNFLVNLTNAYCLLRKVKKYWIVGCSSQEVSQKIVKCTDNAMKLTVQVCADVLQLGVIGRIGVFSKNHAVMQNKLALTLKSYIMSITGNLELSKEILHKQINFINNDEAHREGTIYSGKNYAISLVKQLTRRGVNIKEAVNSLEERFLSQSDKDFLIMIIDSIQKGQKVKVMKVRAEDSQIDSSAKSNAQSSSKITSTQDKHNVQQVFEMLGGTHNRQTIERVYLQNDKNIEKVIDKFLMGEVPQEEEPELHVIIEKKEQKIDTSYNQIQQQKKKEDLKSYLMREYSSILNPKGVDISKAKGNQYYQNHLKALELQRKEEEDDKESQKVLIMQQAQMMQYDDDFDEEEIYGRKDGAANKYGLQVVHGKRGKNKKGGDSNSPSKLKEMSANKAKEGFDGISQIDGADIQDEDEDDEIDEMAKFIEGQDVELVKDYSNQFQDDEKIAKRRQQILDQSQSSSSKGQANSKKENFNDIIQEGKKGDQSESRGGRGRGNRGNRGDRGDHGDRGRGGQGRDQNQRYERRDQPYSKEGGQKKVQPKDPWKQFEQKDNSSDGSNERGSYRGRGAPRGRGRGGDKDEGFRKFDREEKDSYYTTKEPDLNREGRDYSPEGDANRNNQGRGFRGRGRGDVRGRGGERGGRGAERGRGGGRGNQRGGQHNQKDKAKKKYGI